MTYLTLKRSIIWWTLASERNISSTYSSLLVQTFAGNLVCRNVTSTEMAAESLIQRRHLGLVMSFEARLCAQLNQEQGSAVSQGVSAPFHEATRCCGNLVHLCQPPLYLEFKLCLQTSITCVSHSRDQPETSNMWSLPYWNQCAHTLQVTHTHEHTEGTHETLCCLCHVSAGFIELINMYRYLLILICRS